MADSDIANLTADTSPTSDDLLYVVNDPAGTPGDRKVTVGNMATAMAGLSAFTGVYVPQAWHVVKRKSADETVNNSSVMQNDDHLSFAIGASEVWVVSFHLFVSAASATPDLKVALTLPAGATSAMGIIGPATANTILAGDAILQSFTDATTALTVGVIIDSTANNVVRYSACIENSTNAGTVQLQWAQSAATASDTKVRKNSFMIADRIS